jgi:hypothetical protein
MKSRPVLTIFFIFLLLNLFLIEIESLSLSRKLSKFKKVRLLKRKLKRTRIQLRHEREVNNDLKLQIKKCMFNKSPPEPTRQISNRFSPTKE